LAIKEALNKLGEFHIDPSTFTVIFKQLSDLGKRRQLNRYQLQFVANIYMRWLTYPEEEYMRVLER